MYCDKAVFVSSMVSMDHQQVIITGDLVFVLGWVALFVFSMRRWTPERGRDAARKWADNRQVACDDAWLNPVQRQLRTNYHADLVALFFLYCALNLAPAPIKPYAALLVSTPYVVVIARGLSISRQILPPGPRVARARQVTAADYLPGRTRQLAWACAVSGLAACVALGWVRDNQALAAAGLLLLIPPASIEWVGQRLSHMPQPADSAEHLYLQDAFRSDLMGFASFRSALAAATLTGYLGVDAIAGSVAWVPVVLVGVAALLFVGLFRQTGDLRENPAGYMRSRLWRGVAAA